MSRRLVYVVACVATIPTHPAALSEPLAGAEQLRRIGVKIPCGDDVDEVLQGLGMDCEMATVFLREAGGCDADLHDGVGMAANVPAGTMMKGLCPGKCGGCPSDDIFPPPLQFDTIEINVGRAIGTLELARARSVCHKGAGWELLQADVYCDDVHDLNPTGLPLTLAACQALAVGGEACSDTLMSNIERAPTGTLSAHARHTTEHFMCRCAIARPLELAGPFVAPAMLPNRLKVLEPGLPGLASTRPQAQPCQRRRQAESGVDLYRCRRAPLPLPPPPPPDPNATNSSAPSAGAGARVTRDCCCLPVIVMYNQVVGRKPATRGAHTRVRASRRQRERRRRRRGAGGVAAAVRDCLPWEWAAGRQQPLGDAVRLSVSVARNIAP